jgi:Cu(I)/Ag(I) efflux system membrane fusion protein
MTADGTSYIGSAMDANFRQDTPGKSPMGMDTVYAGAEPSADPSAVILSSRRNQHRRSYGLSRKPAQSIETVGFVG